MSKFVNFRANLVELRVQRSFSAWDTVSNYSTDNNIIRGKNNIKVFIRNKIKCADLTSVCVVN